MRVGSQPVPAPTKKSSVRSLRWGASHPCSSYLANLAIWAAPRATVVVVGVGVLRQVGALGSDSRLPLKARTVKQRGWFGNGSLKLDWVQAAGWGVVSCTN